ncbi:MAG: cold shock domain-containing protein [Pseudomonadota bacterium]|nr:cold shock domain-containing protein [Pseudomonadota bacterium]
MPQGSVKWFNNVKGYGFIITQDGSEELFAHFSAIAMAGYKTLLAGEIVEFDVQQCDKGLQAKNIRRYDTETMADSSSSVYPATTS